MRLELFINPRATAGSGLVAGSALYANDRVGGGSSAYARRKTAINAKCWSNMRVANRWLSLRGRIHRIARGRWSTPSRLPVLLSGV